MRTASTLTLSVESPFNLGPKSTLRGREHIGVIWHRRMPSPSQHPLSSVSITKTAYAPSSASLSTADTVRFTNNDTTPHQVAFKATTE